MAIKRRHVVPVPEIPSGDLFGRSMLLTHRWQRFAGRGDPFNGIVENLRREIVSHNAECERIGNFTAKVDCGELPSWDES